MQFRAGLGQAFNRHMQGGAVWTAHLLPINEQPVVLAKGHQRRLRVVQLDLWPVLAPLELLDEMQSAEPLGLRQVETPVSGVLHGCCLVVFGRRPLKWHGVGAVIVAGLGRQADEVLKRAGGVGRQTSEHLVTADGFLGKAELDRFGNLNNSQQAMPLLHWLSIPCAPCGFGCVQAIEIVLHEQPALGR